MDNIKWIETPTSSNIKKVGYDKDNQHLYVQFTTMATYRYAPVPEVVWVDLLNAPSTGRFIIGNIKGKYGYTRLS